MKKQLLYSWNVNGLRAASKKGFAEWFDSVQADFVCLQEIKAFENQLPGDLTRPFGYESFFHSAEKPGYSGVCTFTRVAPVSVRVGLGEPSIDSEGRVLTLEMDSFYLINAYFPNSQREHTRLDYKLFFCQKMFEHCKALEKTGKGVILCGDYNIAHREIDLKNPKQNMDNAGFLPEERAWMDFFLKNGFVDIFRELEPGPGHYTWWSYRPGVREKNIGWRLDYHCISESLRSRVVRAGHSPQVQGSDHCPVYLELTV